MEEDRIEKGIEIPEYLLKVFKFEMERTLNMPWSETRGWIQKYLQSQYDSLGNKDGRVVVNFPTLEQLREYILKETK